MSRRQIPTRQQKQQSSRRVQIPAQGIIQKRDQKNQQLGNAVTVDFLDETEMRKHETIGCIMFASPGETMINAIKEEVAIETNIPLATVDKVVKAYCSREHPKRAVKYVGGYATDKEAEARIKEIEDDEPMFHIFKAENGKWLPFDPSPDAIQNEEYREKNLNELMKSKKLNEQHTKDFYRQEMRKRVERARLEGTKEGQEILMQAEEPLQAVEHRVKTAEEGIKEMYEKIAEFEQTKALAQRKLEYMRANNGTTLDPALQVKDKMDELASKTQLDENRAMTVKSKLAEAQMIESSRRRDVPASEVARQMSGENASLFESDPLIPSNRDA